MTGVRTAGVRRSAGDAAPGGTPRLATGLGGTAIALFVLVGLAGESAAAPPLGPGAAHPPYDLALGLSPAVVDVALVAGYLLAGAAVWLGLRAVEAGWRPPARAVVAAALVAVGALVLVPPIGSADHLSYAAYGRIAAEGGDPYATAPDAWPAGDPVVGSAEAPWDDTTSVYGPVATALQATVAELGGGSLRLTVWLWQVLTGVAWLVAAWLLDRLARLSSGERGRARVAVLWTLNPLLLGAVVGGAHLDALSAAAAVACLAFGVRAASTTYGFLGAQAAAGVALAVAAGTKLPYAAAGAAVLWAHRRFPWRAQVAGAVALLGTALAVLVPAHLWAGGHVYDQAGNASRFTSLATPWRPLVNGLSAAGWDGARDAVPVLFALVAVLTAVAMAGHLRGVRAEPGPVALLALAGAYVVAAPYVLPWYDALLFAPLALVAGTRLDRPLVARLTVLTLAYVPGRAAGEASAVSDVLLGFRQFAAPVATGAVLLWLLVSGVRSLRRAPGH